MDGSMKKFLGAAGGAVSGEYIGGKVGLAGAALLSGAFPPLGLLVLAAGVIGGGALGAKSGARDPEMGILGGFAVTVGIPAAGAGPKGPTCA
jgi:hypothetical protein